MTESEYLVQFTNGVYDLQKHEFIEKLTENLILTSVGYDYISEYSKHKADLINFLVDIVPNELDRKLLLNHVSKGLIGNNYDQVCLNIYGSGNNGKTTFINLVAETLGYYLKKFNSKILTKSLKNNDLYSLIDKRFTVAEIGPTDKINSGTYKSLNSADQFFIKIPHLDESIVTKLVHTMCVVSNTPLEFNNDISLQRRTKYVNFPKTFTNSVEINEKIKLWRQDFMLLMIENYKMSNY